MLSRVWESMQCATCFYYDLFFHDLGILTPLEGAGA